MIRLIGILTGSALAVAAIVTVFGLPELIPTNDAAPNDQAFTAATVAEDITATVTETVAATVTETVAETVAETVTEIAANPVVPAPATIPSQNWYAFWSPFRSEIAADGFISELQRTTGLDYRVVKLKPGVYEVAFAYSDPPDRDTKLDRIAAATGLDVSGG